MAPWNKWRWKPGEPIEKWRENALVEMYWGLQRGGYIYPPKVAEWLWNIVQLSMLR